MTDRKLRIAILGAATAAGRELVPTLEERKIPIAELRLFGQDEEVGETIEFQGEELSVEALRREAFHGIDLLFVPPNVDADPDIFAAAKAAGALIIDGAGTAAGPESLLVFPGINDEELDELETVKGQVIAIASASAAQLAAVLLPLEAKAGLERIEVTSLEAASTYGIAGMEELSMQTVSLLNGREPERTLFPHRIAFNVIPQVGGFQPTGATDREVQIEEETRRLLGRDLPNLSVSCALVPVFYGTCQLLTVQTTRPLGLDAARTALSGGEGLELLDEREASVYPMPMLSVGGESVHVGRMRETVNGLAFVSVADNLRWGAVLPMVRVVELLRETDAL